MLQMRYNRRSNRRADYLPGLIVPTNTAPVSNSTSSPEFAGDSMGPTDVRFCPFTVLARGTIPNGVEVIVGTQPPLEMP